MSQGPRPWTAKLVDSSGVNQPIYIGLLSIESLVHGQDGIKVETTPFIALKATSRHMDSGITIHLTPLGEVSPSPFAKLRIHEATPRSMSEIRDCIL